MLIKRSIKVFIILTVVFVLTAATYAFAAANTLPANTYAGDGAVAISGIDVASVSYTITETSNPATTYITGVTMTLSPAVNGPTVEVKLVAASNTWYGCTTSDAGTTYTCNVAAGNITVTAADNLRVIVK